MKTIRFRISVLVVMLLTGHYSRAQTCAACYQKQTIQICNYVGGPGCTRPRVAGGGGGGIIKREAEIYLGLALQYMTPEQQKQFLNLPATTTQFVNDNQTSLKMATQQVNMTVLDRHTIQMPVRQFVKPMQPANK